MLNTWEKQEDMHSFLINFSLNISPGQFADWVHWP